MLTGTCESRLVRWDVPGGHQVGRRRGWSGLRSLVYGRAGASTSAWFRCHWTTRTTARESFWTENVTGQSLGMSAGLPPPPPQTTPHARSHRCAKNTHCARGGGGLRASHQRMSGNIVGRARGRQSQGYFGSIMQRWRRRRVCVCPPRSGFGVGTSAQQIELGARVRALAWRVRCLLRWGCYGCPAACCGLDHWRNGLSVHRGTVRRIGHSYIIRCGTVSLVQPRCVTNFPCAVARHGVGCRDREMHPQRGRE
ncbi:hypothetical protein BC628DRAFT_763481 [Trametes gibbosa]|nr:hypothetical protein BC628DRAFT_763481 [Trametes gibbosa]